MKMPNGYGSITKLSGKRRRPYLVRTNAKYTDIGGKKSEGRQILGYYATKSEALAALADYNANPYDLSAHKLTFAEVFEKWSAIKFPKVGQKSINSYNVAYRKCADIHNIPFCDLNLLHLQTIMDGLSEKGKSTAQNLKLLYLALYDYAIKHDITEKNYANYVELAYKKKETALHCAISEDKIDNLWKIADADDMAARILILIYTGWRISELIDIDEIDTENMTMKGGKKTTAGKGRIVPIHSRIQPLVLRLLDGDGKVISGSYEGFRYNFNQVFPDNHIHDTRHTFISRLQTAGADHICIERLVGHASKNITDKVYTHKDIDELRKAVELLP